MRFFTESKVRYFDGFPASNLSLLQGSNIYNLGGFSGSSIGGRNNTLETVSYDCRFYGQFIAAQMRLQDYRFHDLIKTVLGLYSDAATSFIDYNATKLIEVEGDKDLSDAINKVFNQIEYLRLLKENFKDVLYSGSVTLKINKLSGDKFEVKDFKYPFTSARYRKEDKDIVMSDSGAKFVSDVLRFSFDDLSLFLDDQYRIQLGLVDAERAKQESGDKNRIYGSDRVTVSEPMFLSAELKLKDYILKDLISSYLSLITLIEQETYSIDGQRISDTVNLLKLCEKVKGLLVTKDDMNLLASARLDKTALIRRLFDRVRVIPSVAGALNNLQKVQGTDVREKLDMINNQKENVRDELLTSIGFPLDLYKGSTNRWEVSRQNDRYSIKQVDMRDMVNHSTKFNARVIGSLLGKDMTDRVIKVLFTSETPYEIQNKVEKINKNKEVLQASADMIRSAGDLMNTENVEMDQAFQNDVNRLLAESGINAKVKIKSDEDKESPTNSGEEGRPAYGGQNPRPDEEETPEIPRFT